MKEKLPSTTSRYYTIPKDQIIIYGHNVTYNLRTL